MLVEVTHWVEMAGVVLEALLLVRLTALKLHRVYAFVTLYWAVSLILDSAQWFYGWESKESSQISLYALFLQALLYPLLAWDVFEEMKPLVAVTLRVQASRLISGLIATVFLATLWCFFLQDQFEKQPGAMTEYFALFLWMGSTAASLLFLWTVYRAIRKQGLALPRNTKVWAVLLLVILLTQIVMYLGIASGPFVGLTGLHILDLVAGVIGVALTIWCGVSVRSVPTDVASRPQQAL
jgi:hypothetical protein